MIFIILIYASLANSLKLTSKSEIYINNYNDGLYSFKTTDNMRLIYSKIVSNITFVDFNQLQNSRNAFLYF